MLFFVLITSCKDKKVSLNSDDDLENISASDFVNFFPEAELPFQVADTTLLKKSDDSLAITYKVFTRFIPDSFLQKDFGKGAKPKLYALGKAKEKERETYLFIKAVQGNKRVAYLACFDKRDSFLNAMPLVKTPIGNSTAVYGLLDTKFQITTYRERKKAQEELSYKKNVYFYNDNDTAFTLIMTEPNEEIIRDVINPIDTVSGKHKYAGDYVADSRNFVSVRDGKNPSEINFFVHFEKNKGECNGELKGKARFISSTVAQYYEPGNPCTIQLSFSNARVTMKETRGCGSYRDIKCYFEGSYVKKKEKKKS